MRFDRVNSWPATRVVALTGTGVVLLTITCFSPRFWLWPAAGAPLGDIVALQPEFHRAFHALRQLADPWQRIDDPVNRVIEWRLFWPVIGHYLALPPAWYLALPHIGCLATVFATAGLVWRSTRDLLPTVALTVLAATSSWFFVSTGWLAYHDSWLILAILLACFGRHGATLLLAALVAPWIDERFLLSLPLCLAVRALGADRPSPPTRGELLKAAGLLLAGIAPYAAVRLGCELSGFRATSSRYWGDRPLLPAPIWVMGWGLWNGLRLGWVLLACSVLLAPRDRLRRISAAFVLLAVWVSLCVADDLSRSASVALPAVIAGGLVLWRDSPDRARRLLPWLGAGNLLLPAQHIIAAPGTTALWHSVPVLSVTAELERVGNPPDFANPDTYNRRSIDHLQNGHPDRALAANEIALRFAPRHAKSIANRGILFFLSGRRDEGLRELDRALGLSPALYDARLQRASFRQQMGNLVGALEDARQALRDMPPDWPRRQGAEQFERALASQIGR
ncbi:MAG: hypothetical protein HZC55_13235 [Verrucomicrobia bacterium]|nr:hypothetical protein [Verrucomicrobiota bacterium]